MRHIPNIISTLRILIIPLFVWQLVEGHTLAAGIVLILSGISDFVDGFLARRFGWVSDVGKVLDPLSDKLTQVTVCIMFLVLHSEYWPFFAFLIFKEVVMLTLGSSLVRGGVHIEGARWFGKVTTVLFYLVMVALILFPGLPVWANYTLLTLVTLCALIAGLLYIPEYRRYKKQLKENRQTQDAADSPAQQEAPPEQAEQASSK